MQVRLRIAGPPAPPLPRSARRRPLGFCCSLVLHAAAFAFLLWPSAEYPEHPNVYTSLIAPAQKDHKLIWYQFKEQLPEVSPSNPTVEKEARVLTPQKARQQIVTAPQAQPGKQFIFIPAPQIKLKTDLSAPNLIALQPTVVSAPEKPQAKPFLAPEPPKPSQPPPATVLPTAPALAPNEEQNPVVDALVNKPLARPRRDFTPPAPPANPQPSNSPAALPAAPSLEAAHGPAGVSVAILGLNPANAPQVPAPEGARAARIAAGPDTGDQPQLAKGNSPLTIPDVSIQGKPGPSTPSATGPRQLPSTKPGLGTAPMPAVQPASLQSTSHVSVPQWPSSRTLPGFIERRFHTRVVYTTVLPAAPSGEDWVVWFAEEAPTPMDTRLVMRPPTLMHGAPLPPVPAREDHGTGKLLIAGVLKKDGHFGSFIEQTDAADRELLDALQSWQFNPAMRNGVPVDVEAVLEIPMVYAAANLTVPK